MKVKEVLIVEGKNDTIRLQECIDCDTIETHGTCLSKWTMNFIKKAQKDRGVIIFTDPDAPGDKIRSIINNEINGCKNAFIKKEIARTDKKVGVEHAANADILESLSQLLTYDKDYKETLSYSDFIDLGLSGDKNSSSLRLKISRYYNLGECNAKTLYKRINMFKLNKEDIEKVLI
jgi:ribonuclease M5